jgi:hypothetical protein
MAALEPYVEYLTQQQSLSTEISDLAISVVSERHILSPVSHTCIAVGVLVAVACHCCAFEHHNFWSQSWSEITNWPHETSEIIIPQFETT